MHFKSIATFLAKSANEKKNPFGRRKVASAECELSVDHITITPAMWRRLGAGMQRSASAGPQLQHERGGAYWQTKALQTSRLSPNSHLFPTVRQRQNDDLRLCRPCEKCEWWGRRERAPVNFLKESFADEETCRDWYRIEHPGWWLDQRVAILADQPLCSDELDDQLSSLLCQLIHQHARVVSAAVCNSAGCWDRVSARCARGDRRARWPRLAQLSCCGFWNRVIAHAWKFPQAYGAFLVMVMGKGWKTPCVGFFQRGNLACPITMIKCCRVFCCVFISSKVQVICLQSAWHTPAKTPWGKIMWRTKNWAWKNCEIVSARVINSGMSQISFPTKCAQHPSSFYVENAEINATKDRVHACVTERTSDRKRNNEEYGGNCSSVLFAGWSFGGLMSIFWLPPNDATQFESCSLSHLLNIIYFFIF